MKHTKEVRHIYTNYYDKIKKIKNYTIAHIVIPEI